MSGPKAEAPNPVSNREITRLLRGWSAGERKALEQLAEAVHHELRRLAQHHLRGERSDHTLQPTALVNETYLRLMPQKDVQWKNRSQFFAIASRMMRRVLVDHARKHLAAKRGGGAIKVTWNDSIPNEAAADRVDLVALNDALVSLTELDPRQGQIVELLYFGGLTMEEAARVLNISPGTVRREWRLAKLWLYREIQRI